MLLLPVVASADHQIPSGIAHVNECPISARRVRVRGWQEVDSGLFDDGSVSLLGGLI
jgi:hypothetical protein